MSAAVCVNDGDTHKTPVESSGAKAPWSAFSARCVQTLVVQAKFRGGLGGVQQVELLTSAMYHSQVERTHND